MNAPAPTELLPITDEMIEAAIDAHTEPFDSGDAVGAMRVALSAALRQAASVSQPEVQTTAAVTDEMIERAIDAHVELFDSGDAVGAMRAALTAALGVAQESWMPIETAPKDRKRILLYQAGRGAFEGWWHTAWPHPEEYWMDDADSEPNPTHWRPTLAPPSADCGGGK